MKDRFDLEQEIMQCWNIVDDLKMLIDNGYLNNEKVDSLIDIYGVKFETLFNTFEDCSRSAFKIRTYGDDETWHSNKYLDVETSEGAVVGVWFRCQLLPFKQSEASEFRAEEVINIYKDNDVPDLLSVKLEDKKVS